jgi:hypothetical protein
VNGRDLLAAAADAKAEDFDSRLWRLSFKDFTLTDLKQRLSDEWAIPIEQLEIKPSPTIDVGTKLRLPDGKGVLTPVAN